MADTMRTELCKQGGMTGGQLAWDVVGLEASSVVRSMLEGDVALAIVRAHIVAVDAGDGFVSAELNGDVKLHHAESRKVPFPMHMEFQPPGLAIA